MNVICLHLPHHIRPSYCAIDIWNYDLLILIPKEYFKFCLLDYSVVSNFKDKFGSILSHFQFHFRNHLWIWCFPIFDDLLLVNPNGWLNLRRLFLDIQFGHIITSKYWQPSLLSLCLDDTIYKFILWLDPKGVLTSKNSRSQLPRIQSIVNSND